jgi:phosphatidylethanolamine-binding protein (PEBP) family uncharacterized protein
MKYIYLLSVLTTAVSFNSQALEITSQDIHEGQLMAKTFEYSGMGCDGGNQSPQGASGKLTQGLETRTDYGKPGFGGACPPVGNGMHRYQFTVWALPQEKIDLPADISPAVVGFTLNSMAIDKAILTATYVR